MKLVLFFTLISTLVLGAKMNDIDLNTTDNNTINLSKTDKKLILVSNIATRCGYTGQLSGLEKIYKKYKDKGLLVIGIPSNDFGGQTPEDNKEVEKFCRLNYGASFPILKKAVVKGSDKHPLIKELLKKTDDSEISWNFEKFLITSEGKVTRYKSGVEPESVELTKAIESNL